MEISSKEFKKYSVSKSILFQKVFCFTVKTKFSSDLKNFVNSKPSASIFFSITPTNFSHIRSETKYNRKYFFSELMLIPRSAW